APAPVDRERDCAARGLRARDRCGGRAAGRRITPAAEWFIDNYYVIEELAGDKLLPAVDVVGRARQGRVGHDVYGERGDAGRSNDAADGLQRGERSCGEPIDLNDSFGKGVRSFLRRVAADAIEDSVRILARELLGVDFAVPGRAIEIRCAVACGHGDEWSLGKVLFRTCVAGVPVG